MDSLYLLVQRHFPHTSMSPLMPPPDLSQLQRGPTSTLPRACLSTNHCEPASRPIIARLTASSLHPLELSLWCGPSTAVPRSLCYGNRCGTLCPTRPLACSPAHSHLHSPASWQLQVAAPSACSTTPSPTSPAHSPTSPARSPTSPTRSPAHSLTHQATHLPCTLASTAHPFTQPSGCSSSPHHPSRLTRALIHVQSAIAGACIGPPPSFVGHSPFVPNVCHHGQGHRGNLNTGSFMSAVCTNMALHYVHKLHHSLISVIVLTNVGTSCTWATLCRMVRRLNLSPICPAAPSSTGLNLTHGLVQPSVLQGLLVK